MQQPDGLWGYFHTLSRPARERPMTTEQALRRLKALGFTAQDEPVARALAAMRTVLRGGAQMPDGREKVLDWDIFEALMMAAWIRYFVPDDPEACQTGALWAGILAAALAGGEWDDAAYRAAYVQRLRKLPKGARYINPTCFYVVALVANLLDAQTQARYFAHLLTKPDGIYYVYDKRLDAPPVFASLQACRYLGALELLAVYDGKACREGLGFAVAWLDENRVDGQWDLGGKARDGVYFPLSDDWRKAQTRRADCTARVGALYARLTAADDHA